MTGPRPPYGGNPDDPTMRGYSQNPADATRRADLGDIATGKADALAWSHEGPQPGAAPTPNYGGDPYQQYPPYQQPQYEPAAIWPAAISTAAVRATRAVRPTTACGTGQQVAHGHDRHRRRGARRGVARRRTGLHVDRKQRAGAGSDRTADAGASAGARSRGACGTSVGSAATAPPHRHPPRATTVRQVGRTPVARPRVRRPAAPPARPPAPFQARQREPPPVAPRAPRPASPRRPRAPRRGPRPVPKARRRGPRGPRRRTYDRDHDGHDDRYHDGHDDRYHDGHHDRHDDGHHDGHHDGHDDGDRHRKQHWSDDNGHDDWHNDRWRRRPGIGDVQHRWVDDRHALPPGAAALLIRPGCSPAGSGSRPTGRRRARSRARSRTPTGR